MSTNSSKSQQLKNLLTEENILKQVREWLKEDIPSFDYGGFVVGDKEDQATLLCKSPGVLAGVPYVNAIFNLLECKVEWLEEEGGEFWQASGENRVSVARVRGPACKILQGERLALNILARCSGVATRARKMVSIKEENGWPGVVAGTRKTTPGFRDVEKYGMLVGGADTHRMDLSSMIMLKDNHVWSHGSITKAVKMAKSVGGFSLKVEVECRSWDEANEAILAGADIVMLDNFEPKAGIPPFISYLRNQYS